MSTIFQEAGVLSPWGINHVSTHLLRL